MKNSGKVLSCWLVLEFTCCFFTGVSQAKKPETVLNDAWSLTKMAGGEVGWTHQKTTQVVKKRKTQYRTEITNFMEMKRFGQSIKISSEGWTLEDPTGRIVKMHLSQAMSGNKTINDLEVKGKEAYLTITTMGTPRKSKIAWDDSVLGPEGIRKLRKKMGCKPGVKFSYMTFSFDYSKKFKVSVEIKGNNSTGLLDGKTKTLCHSQSSMEFLPGVKINEWCDKNWESQKTSLNMMGISIETFRTTRQRARKSGGGELKPDLLKETLSRSNVNLPRPYRLDSILYRFKAKDTGIGLPDKLDTVRQKVVKTDGREAMVLIRSMVPKQSQERPMKSPPAELLEYLQPNAFIQSDHAGIRAKALEVVGKETNAWKAACLLEHFVFEYIKQKDFATGFASAAEVFENPKGDCSEHGVLLSAMCRAVGIPSRVALGYMYLGGMFGGHMWTEVWIKGKWYPVDGVMGIGRTDPTHIHFSSSSLKHGSLAGIFTEAIKGLGNLEIEILEFTQGNKTVKIGKSFKDHTIKGNTYKNLLYGVSITKPKNHSFKNYKRDLSGLDFTLVEIKGKSSASFSALPATFSFSMDKLKEAWTKEGGKILSEKPRKIGDRSGRVLNIKQKDKSLRILALVDQDTCYVLKMSIKSRKRDLADFESMAKSIRFSR
jgi:hypothetical protein